jgi:ribonuclease BN (tRNA processing enzyme)
VRVRVLGSGSYLADPLRGSPGTLLRVEQASLLVDAGSGTLQRLARAGLDPAFLDAVILTHRHVDHCADLAALLFCMKHQRSPRRVRDLVLVGSEGLGEHLDRLYALWGSSLMADSFDLQVVELPLCGPGEADLPGGVVVASVPANHSEGALHYRFRAPDGVTVVVSGDTGPSEALEQLAAGADLLLCECGLPTGESFPAHLDAVEVARIVAAARPRRVLLHHYAPRPDLDADVARIVATGVPTAWSEDGMEIDVRRVP